MTLFQLFKDRSFGDYISDPIDFFKKFGKHYFTNYFAINGIFLLLISISTYFFSKFYFDLIQSSINAPLQNSNAIEAFFRDNAVLFLLIFILMVFFILFFSMINFAFPSLYIRLFEDKGTNFDTKEIIGLFKENFGRIIIFGLLSLLIFPFIFFIVMLINFGLVFLIIGIPLFFITLPALVIWANLSFNNYLLHKTPYFQSLSNGFTMLRNNFWPMVGSTLIFYILIQIVQGVLTFIPYTIGITSLISTGNSLSNPETSAEGFGAISIMATAFIIATILISYTFNNFIAIQQLLIYYSQIEKEDNNEIQSEIDLIGSDVE
jgi:hypothetical protein